MRLVLIDAHGSQNKYTRAGRTAQKSGGGDFIVSCVAIIVNVNKSSVPFFVCLTKLS